MTSTYLLTALFFPVELPIIPVHCKYIIRKNLQEAGIECPQTEAIVMNFFKRKIHDHQSRQQDIQKSDEL